jgi:hypothetical protein
MNLEFPPDWRKGSCFALTLSSLKHRKEPVLWVLNRSIDYFCIDPIIRSRLCRLFPIDESSKCADFSPCRLPCQAPPGGSNGTSRATLSGAQRTSTSERRWHKIWKRAPPWLWPPQTAFEGGRGKPARVVTCFQYSAQLATFGSQT